MDSFYSYDELRAMGFKHIGKHILISRKASFYDIGNIYISDYIRIDDFCILSGHIHLGSYIHLSAYCALYGSQKISMDDFSGLSTRVTVFSTTDDFNGDFLIGPMVSNDFRNVIGGCVKIEKYVQVGSGSVILPAVTLAEGSAVGALSLVNRNTDKWKIYAGIPAKYIKDRSKKLLIKKDEFLKSKDKNES